MSRFVWLLSLAAAGRVIGQPAPAPPAFEVASIRPAQTPQGRGLIPFRETVDATPGSLTLRNVTLTTCIRWAYDLKPFEISGPPWLGEERFDITAKAANAVPEEQLRLMLRALLAERFKLAAHRESKEMTAYALVVGKNGSKLRPAEGEGAGSMTGAALVFQGHQMPLSRLADILSSG